MKTLICALFIFLLSSLGNAQNAPPQNIIKELDKKYPGRNSVPATCNEKVDSISADFNEDGVTDYLFSFTRPATKEDVPGLWKDFNNSSQTVLYLIAFVSTKEKQYQIDELMRDPFEDDIMNFSFSTMAKGVVYDTYAGGGLSLKSVGVKFSTCETGRYLIFAMKDGHLRGIYNVFYPIT